MARQNNGVVRRIDLELDIVLQDIAKKNQMSLKQASRELARISKTKLKGGIISNKIRF